MVVYRYDYFVILSNYNSENLKTKIVYGWLAEIFVYYLVKIIKERKPKLLKSTSLREYVKCTIGAPSCTLTGGNIYQILILIKRNIYSLWISYLFIGGNCKPIVLPIVDCKATIILHHPSLSHWSNLLFWAKDH